MNLKDQANNYWAVLKGQISISEKCKLMGLPNHAKISNIDEAFYLAHSLMVEAYRQLVKSGEIDGNKIMNMRTCSLDDKPMHGDIGLDINDEYVFSGTRWINKSNNFNKN